MSKLPQPKVSKMHWPVALVWAIPILAAIAAGYFYYEYVRDHGPLITIKFSDGTGLIVGQTQVTHRGVSIGEVVGIDLAEDNRTVLVQAQLRRPDEAFAEAGARFWVVRPEISAGSISGLSTVISGPFIESTPGSGESTREFTGLDRPPVSTGPGLKVVLYADRMEHLPADAPVYYRGIQVGAVQGIELSDDATRVNVRLMIWERYRGLVRSNSKFWLISGADVKGGLLSGVEVKVDSLRSLITGGISFATEDADKGDAAKDGAEFPLNDAVKPEWLKWAPRIPVTPTESSEPDRQSDVKQQGDAILNSATGTKGK